MNIRGNYNLFYVLEFITGILLIVLFNFYGDFGLLGLILFMIALVMTQKTNPDEREVYLIYKIGGYEGIIIGAAMTIIYFKFPEINWFYALLSISLISRGLIGYFTFKFG